MTKILERPLHARVPQLGLSVAIRTTGLRLERAVLFAEEGDHNALLAPEPAKPRCQEHLQRNHR